MACRSGIPLAAALLATFQTACNHTSPPQTAAAPLVLTSSSFAGDAIPDKFTCRGQDISPEIAWKSAPQNSQSFVLIMTDRDARLGPILGAVLHWLTGYFLHWLVYNIPASQRELAEGLPKQVQLADGTRQGRNDFEKPGYGGPCPPAGSAHHYRFEVYALDSQLDLPAGVDEKEIRGAMRGHILAEGQMVGLYPVR